MRRRVLLLLGLVACSSPAPDAGEAVVPLAALPARATGTTRGAAHTTFRTYGCAGSSALAGPEIVYRVSVPTEGLLIAQVEGAPVALRLLRALDAGACLDAHDAAVAARVPAGDVYVVVDSAEGSGGDFVLRVALTTPATFSSRGLREELAADAFTAVSHAWAWGATRRTEFVVADYSIHSSQPREWVFDLASGELLHHLRVAHGRRSTDGVDLGRAVRFSNTSGSNQSSLGLFRSAGPYVGTFGPSFRLEGLEPGINDAACARDIVMHPWSPVGDEYVARCGWARPSLGCPAIDAALAAPVRDRLARPRGAALDRGVPMFFWHPDASLRAQSPYLSGDAPSDAVRAQLAVECDSSQDGTPSPPSSGEYACD